MVGTPKSAGELASAINAGRLQADAGVEASHAAIIERNPSLNALVDFKPEDADEQLAALAQRLDAGERPPLAGVPIAVKDHIMVRGWRHTEGSVLFRNRIADADDHVICRLRQAGAIFVGRSNMSEFGCKGVTSNMLYGSTRNPLDLHLTPGGSSGGAASAVAAGLVPLALASDGGGSIRRPAAHVGVVGFKPSSGAVADPRDFTHTGVLGALGTSVADCAALFEVIAGPDPADPVSLPMPPLAGSGNAGPRVAWSPQLGLDVPIDEEVAEVVETAVERLRAAGLRIERADPVWPAGASEETLMPIQHAGLAVHFGETWRRDPGIFDPDIGDQIRSGLALSGVDVARANGMSLSIARSAARFFAGGFSFLLCPTVPCVAWSLTSLGPAEIGGERVGPRAHAVLTPFFNHAYCPAISIPAGVGAQSGLPVGLQIAGPRFSDRSLLAFAAQAEATLGKSP